MKRLLSFLGRLTVTAFMLALAVLVGWQMWFYYMEEPWTRDGKVRADIVAVAPDVSGLVTEVLVRDNQEVRPGDVLFRIDPERFRVALRQADAAVAGRKAALDQAASDLARYSQLSENVVSQQKLEQTVATQQQAEASYRAALADRDLAQLNLARSEVHASVGGRITNMELRPGTYVSVGKGVMALLDLSTLHVDGYFEETKLPRIHIGDKVTVKLMGETRQLSGHVDSIAGGIEDRDRSEGASLLANVNPTFSWVRLAQRVPVRITLDDVPDAGQLVVGRTATVAVHSPQGGPASLQVLRALKDWRSEHGVLTWIASTAKRLVATPS
ncbi:MAG TPA: HlyD family secretion protein [Enterovirga sp.]|nr:HlyD family secretion protein [Enterovirga sp.]